MKFAETSMSVRVTFCSSLLGRFLVVTLILGSLPLFFSFVAVSSPFDGASVWSSIIGSATIPSSANGLSLVNDTTSIHTLSSMHTITLNDTEKSHEHVRQQQKQEQQKEQQQEQQKQQQEQQKQQQQQKQQHLQHQQQQQQHQQHRQQHQQQQRQHQRMRQQHKRRHKHQNPQQSRQPGPNIFNNQIHTRIKYLPRRRDTSGFKRISSCVQPCTAIGPVKISLPPQNLCIHDVPCLFAKVGYKRTTSKIGRCIENEAVSCPTPYRTDCKLYSTNHWTIRLPTIDSNFTFHYSLLVTSEARPFRIISIHSYPDPQYLMVVANYLPTFLYHDACNRILCTYTSPTGQRIEAVAQAGDFTFAYCPHPLLHPDVLADSQSNHHLDAAQEHNGIVPSQASLANWQMELSYSDHLKTPPIVFPPALPTPPQRHTNDTLSSADKDHSYDSKALAMALHPKVTAAICTMVRKEGANIREWLEFHLMLGVGRIILYDNNPTNDLAMEAVIKQYSRRVVIHPWPWRHSQAAGMTDCIARYGSSADWMLLLDADEYLIPINPAHKIDTALLTVPSTAVFLRVSWVTFGPCGTQKRSEGTLLMEICHHLVSPEIQRAMFKSLVRPSHVAGMKSFSPHEVRLHHDVGKLSASRPRLADDLFRIYHYKYRSWPEFHDRRLGDTAARLIHRSEEDVQYMWDNALVGLQPINASQNLMTRYILPLKNRLA